MIRTNGKATGDLTSVLKHLTLTTKSATISLGDMTHVCVCVCVCSFVQIKMLLGQNKINLSRKLLRRRFQLQFNQLIRKPVDDISFAILSLLNMLYT